MFVLCVLVVLFWHWALKWVMVPDSTGLCVRLAGWCDIHCKFLSTFRGCVLPNESICIDFHVSYGPIGPTTCVNYAFCIVFEWYFVLVFCLCFVHKFHSKVAPCICAWLVLCLNLSSRISVNDFSIHFV